MTDAAPSPTSEAGPEGHAGDGGRRRTRVIWNFNAGSKGGNPDERGQR
jgi:hypothetical protein